MTLRTETGKKLRIEQAVTLQSCNNNQAERTVKISRLMQIYDTPTLEYVLNCYVEPYLDFTQGMAPEYKDCRLTTNQFLANIKGDTELIDWFCTMFYVPVDTDSNEDIKTMVRIKKQMLNGNGTLGHTNAPKEF